MRTVLLITLFSIVCFVTGYSQISILSLNSSNSKITWEVKPEADVSETGYQLSRSGFQMQNFIKGVVPGTIFTAYVEAGLEEDPNYGDNIYKVDESFYSRPFWYRTEFETPASYSEGQRIWLHFDGTNRFADFYFNGTKLSGSATSTKDVSGHMIRTSYDVTGLLNKSGKNAIAVLITDAEYRKNRTDWWPFGNGSSPTYMSAAGWDWMPYVPGRLAGITGNAYLKITGDVIMEDPWVRSDLPSLEQAEISISSVLKNASAFPQAITFSGTIQPGNIQFSKSINLPANETSKISIDKNDFSQLVIDNPDLWWPNGYGEPNLYTCNLTCIVDGKVSDEKEIVFGIRKYEYGMINNIKNIPVMTFFINGQKLFLKGGNWGMSEYLLRCHGEEYETKIKLHKDMNYNMIRLWTGCVTDDEFYNYCDKYGIMVWDDFWLYVSMLAAGPESARDFQDNALDKVRRLRNHPSIALWCGANETSPPQEIDDYLRNMIAVEDNNDRMYKSCSNQDGLSGSGWWSNQTPKHHFETSASNLAWDGYPYGVDYGYGLRSEIGTGTFPTYESIIEFIPSDQLWPLPTDNQLDNDDEIVWNRHFFGKEASNADPKGYRSTVNSQFGESSNLIEFSEKAQYLNLEVMKGMYEAWNDKMWNDATGILIWMSQSAYPSFVWQTYDYYYDAAGAYWGAKKACEPIHIQWNSSNNSVKVINTTRRDYPDLKAKSTVYNLEGEEYNPLCMEKTVHSLSNTATECFVLKENADLNLALKKAVYASGVDPNYSENIVSHAVDGNIATRWQANNTANAWFYVDLGESIEINVVKIFWENAYGRDYLIQVSEDANNWTTVYTRSGGDGGNETLTFDPVITRYVKFQGVTRGTAWNYSFWEFEVYAPVKDNGKNNNVELSNVYFIRLELTDEQDNLISENFYWVNDQYNYQALNTLPLSDVRISETQTRKNGKCHSSCIVTNLSSTVAFGNRLKVINKQTKKRVLPIYMDDNYFTLMPGESKHIEIEFDESLIGNTAFEVVLRQYGDYDSESGTSIEKLNNSSSLQSLKVYPNPVSDVLRINIAHSDIQEVRIYDISGRVVYTGRNESTIDVSSLPNGFYLLSILVDGNVYSAKFFKK